MKFVSRYLFPIKLGLWKGEGVGGGVVFWCMLAFNMTVFLRRPIFEMSQMISSYHFFFNITTINYCDIALSIYDLTSVCYNSF